MTAVHWGQATALRAFDQRAGGALCRLSRKRIQQFANDMHRRLLLITCLSCWRVLNIFDLQKVALPAFIENLNMLVRVWQLQKAKITSFDARSTRTFFE